MEPQAARSDGAWARPEPAGPTFAQAGAFGSVRAPGVGTHRASPAAPLSPDAVYSPERITALTAMVTRGARPTSMESAARRVVTALRAAFPVSEGESAVVLARLFQTTVWDLLTPQLRSYALARLPAGASASGTKCLALMATHGERPSWCDRHASRDHQALPLISGDVIRRVPLALTVLDHLVSADKRQETVRRPPGAHPARVAVHLVSQAAGSPLVPAQWLIGTYGVSAALGIGGTLPNGEVFTTVLFLRVPVDARIARRFETVAETMRATLAPFTEAPLFDPAPPVERVVPRYNSALEETGTSAILPPAVDDGAGWSVRPRAPFENALREQRERLAQESRIVETLYSVGQSMSRQLELRKLVQNAIEAATSVVNAKFGAFFYTVSEPNGSAATHYAVAGLPPESFSRFGLPRSTRLFGTQPPGRSPIRLGDVTMDPRYGANPPHRGMPAGHPPVRSYLAVPVIAASGEILGVFYFGHPEPDVFTERDEQLAKGIAAQAATAMENARLYRQERNTAMRLQHSLLPAAPTRLGDLDIATTYLAGEQGSRVGGDWFDVITLSADRIALVIGDVMGRGIGAAAVMGQLRSAVQAYAVMDLPPAQVLDHLNHLICRQSLEQIATCVYAVFDPSEGTVRWANAGHLPPALVAPDGTVTLLEKDLGMPLGVDGAVFDDLARPLPEGSRLLLYTDGLVECRDQALHDRLTRLRNVLTELCAPQAALDVHTGCARLTEEMLTGAEHDDVAVLFVAVRPGVTRKAELALSPTLEAARAARRFALSTLSQWDMDDLSDSVCSIVSELVTNAVEHAGTAMLLRLRHRSGSLLVEVADRDGRLARATPTDSGDERHRGLVIVSTLAERWGVRPTEAGKVVWAQLAVPGGENDPALETAGSAVQSS